MTWNRLLMRVDNNAGKGTSGMDKFGSVINRMNTKLGIEFINSLRIKTKLTSKGSSVLIVVDGATHFKQDGVESNGGSLEGGAEAYLYAPVPVRRQLVVRSSVLKYFTLMR